MTTRAWLGLVLSLLCATRAQAQVDWDALPEGRWTEVSSNTLADLDPCPARDCSYSAVEGQSGVINDWCGGAFAAGYGALGGLVAWGGGHNGYFGSEVYVFDLESGRWERVSEPYDDGSGSVAAMCSEDGVYPDGSACPTHTYDQVDYHPATNRFVILGGTPDPVCGGCVDDRVHLFDLDDDSWELGARKDGPVYYGGTSAYDAERDLFWLLSAYAHTFASYDPAADEWTDYGSPGGVEIDGAGVIDPERDIYLFVDGRGSGELYAIPLDAPDSDFVELTVEGDVEIQSRDKIGLDLDTSTGRFVGWDDGADLFLLDAPSGDWRTGTWRWTRVAPESGGETPVRNENGTYGRLRYAASVNAFVLVSSTEGPVWAYRVSPGAGSGPTPRPDAGTSVEPDAGVAGSGGAGGSMTPVPVGTTADAGMTTAGTNATPSGEDGGMAGTPTSGADADSGGCGCRVVSGGRRPGAMLAALLVLALGGARAARRRRKLTQRERAATLLLLLGALLGCGDDDTDIVASECGAACETIAGECGVPTPSAGDCSAACTLAGGLAPACADGYAAVIACARARPLLACQDSTVSVTLSGDCLDPLGDYLVCAAASITPICVDLPLQNAACVAQGLPRAAACVGTSPGCELQAGAVLDDQGVGVFCCPP